LGNTFIFDFKNLEVLDLRFFVGDVIIEVGLGLLAHLVALGPNCRRELLVSFS